MDNKNSRMLYIDILNIVSIVAVIALHCNGIVHTYSSSRAWKTSLIVEVVCYWAVPIFLMISGATLMDYRKKYDTKTFLKKRCIKVLFPAVFWIAFMIFWKIKEGILIIDNFSFKEILNLILLNKEEYTYYYIFVILGIYLTMPLLSHLTNEEHRKTLWYIVVLSFIFNSTLPVFCEYLGIFYNSDLTIQIGRYLIFIILGYLLSTQELNKKARILIYLSGICSMLFRYIMIYYLSEKDGVLNRWLFDDYSQFHSVLLACSVFVFIKNINYEKYLNKRIIYCLPKISICSFGIYLIHVIVIFYEIKIFSVDVFSWEWRVFGILGTYLISLFIIMILKKIPLIKKVVP